MRWPGTQLYVKWPQVNSFEALASGTSAGIDEVGGLRQICSFVVPTGFRNEVEIAGVVSADQLHKVGIEGDAQNHLTAKIVEAFLQRCYASVFPTILWLVEFIERWQVAAAALNVLFLTYEEAAHPRSALFRF